MADPTLAEKIDHLLETSRKPDGSKYSYVDIQAATKNTISAEYVRKLHLGRAQNPGLKVIKILAEFFDVSPLYFFEGYQELEAESGEIDPSLDKIKKRAAKLDPLGKQRLLEMLDYIEGVRGQKITGDEGQDDEQ